MNKKPEACTFEEALAGLEAAVDTLRSEAVSLDDSVREFQNGMAYYERCRDLLGDVKGQVELYAKETDSLEELES